MSELLAPGRFKSAIFGKNRRFLPILSLDPQKSRLKIDQGSPNFEAPENFENFQNFQSGRPKFDIRTLKVLEFRQL